MRDGDKFQQRRMWLPLTLTLCPRHIVLHVPNDSRYMPGGNAKAPDLFAGSRLQGRRLVRLTYLDDAGLFNPKQEPFIVIGGAIIDADKQLIALEEHIESLVRQHIPEEDWDGFVFHAKDIWHGGKYFKDKKNWPFPKRLDIMRDLADIPLRFEVPVAFGFQAREYMVHYPAHFTDKQRELTGHVDSFGRFSETVGQFMRECAPDEVTLPIFEDRDSIRQMIKEAHALYRNPARMREINPLLRYFPFTHIRDTVHFAKKSESRHLQIADACTFISKRHLMGDAAIEPFYQALKPWMIALPKGEEEAAHPWERKAASDGGG